EGAMISLALVLCTACCGEATRAGWDAVCQAMSYWSCWSAAQDQIDWVAYYRDQGPHIAPGVPLSGGPPRVSTCPVFVSPSMQWVVPNGGPGAPAYVSPSMQWAVPNGCLSGPPCGPPCPPPGGYAH